jgi:nitrate reductase gamma subunit
MKLNIKAYATAQAVTAAILFAVCSFFVGFLPDPTLSFTRYAFHTDLSGIMRPLSIGGFIVGLLVISLGWGLLSLIMARIYNSRIETKSPPS